MTCKLGLMLAFFLLVLSIFQLEARGDIEDEPFAFRLNLALDRTSNYTDVIGRQASTASPYGSSNNPAAPDFLRTPPFAYNLVGAVDTNHAFFQSGAWVESFVGAFAWRPEGDAGTFRLVYVRSDTQDGASRQSGPSGQGEIILRNDKLGLGYSKKIDHRWSLGGEVNLTDATLNVEGMTTLGGFAVPSETHTHSLALDCNLGVMYAANAQWILGASGGMGWSRDKTKLTAYTPGPTNFKVTDTTQSANLRMGVSYQPDPRVGLIGDVQYLHFDNDQGSADVARVLMGMEVFTPHHKMAVRAGISVDTDADVVYSVGVGYYGWDHLSFELAYRYNAFPEITHELGRASLVSVSAAVSF